MMKMIFGLTVLIVIYVPQCLTLDPHLIAETSIGEEDKSIECSCRRRTKSPDDKEFRVVWLAPKTEYHNFSAPTSSGSVKLAIAYIFKKDILKDYRVRYMSPRYLSCVICSLVIVNSSEWVGLLFFYIFYSE